MRQIGDLRSAVGLYERTPATVGGESRDDWTLIGLYAAEIRQQSDRTFAAGDARYQESVIFVTIRTLRTHTLCAGLQVRYKGRRYDVAEVVPDSPKPGFTKLRCTAVDMEGTGVC